MADFDHVFGLPAPRLKVVSTFSGPADPWLANGEEVLDTEMVHAIAPGAALTIVLVNGGTSARAPLWAGIITLADQYAGRHLGFVNPAIYRIALSAHYHQVFHDITTGNNTASFPHVTVPGYEAGPGWDAVTGWGSPDAQVLVPLLAA